MTHNQSREKYLSWGPQGKQVAYTLSSEGAEDYDIYMLDLASGESTQLTDTPIGESEIAWSPDGKWIAYHAAINDSDHIYLLNREDKSIKQITQDEAYHGEPEWFEVSKK